MIGFELSAEQKRWKEKAKAFTQEEIKPLAWKIDKGLTQKYHWPLLAKMAKQGLLNMGVPESYGGSGMDILTTAIVLEELAVGDGGISFTASLNSFNALLIAGNEEQQKQFLPLLCDTENPGLVAFALTEPNAGSDAGSLRTEARREGDDYVLNGEKSFISNGDIARVYAVFATVDKGKGIKGITGFIVPGDAQGLTPGKIEDKMGFRSSRTAGFFLNDVRIPEHYRLGEEGQGFIFAMKELDVLRVLSCGAVGVGVARAAYEDAVGFFKTVGDVKKIMGQQAISFHLADMLASIEASRLMVWKNSWMLDNKVPLGAMTSLTKFYVSDTAVEVANTGVQLLGHHAYTEKYPLEKYVRDAKILQIYEGTNEITRLVASREIFSN
ncbi:MAG: acyl-CoA dehydrogenase family protein [Deltaproteobacteria bacterium]|jgi:alkylation response protein AidB-like acyl-CoA dehydrogenase